MPSSIVSDRDPRMTSLFWRGLFENLGTKLNFSLAYHSQIDGQSEFVNLTILALLKNSIDKVGQRNQWEKHLPLVEIANLTIVDLLNNYIDEVGQRNQWEKHLPLVEYAYNNTVHT